MSSVRVAFVGAAFVGAAFAMDVREREQPLGRSRLAELEAATSLRHSRPRSID
jgi:hypothetical protein